METKSVIEEAVPDAEVITWDNAESALQELRSKKKYPDIVFSDIEMPGVSGLELAIRVKEITPDTRIVFVTGFSQYALDAFKIHAHGYLLKPATPEQILEEITAIKRKPEEKKEKLQIQCFGNFEVFWNGRPVSFTRHQTKELFAYLIDRNGAACTVEELAAILWEDEDDVKSMGARIRNLISDLKHTLEEIGMEDLMYRRRGLIAIQKDRIDCDYYRMLAGDMDAVNAFRGEYMSQYSWASITEGTLTFEQWEKQGR
ncbi:MAG: response regulator [Lachnospiraceae bacterium]|nr:response regulator [Lachnospiraceae bacterium]